MQVVGNSRLLLCVFICLFAAPGVAPAQCSDFSTSLARVHHLRRTGGNNVEALAGTQIVGDYWYTWEAYVSSTERVGNTAIHSGADGVGYGGNDQVLAGGTAAGLRWNDAPSQRGSGTYSTSNYHEADSQCGDFSQTNTSDTLTVNKPTVGGLPINTYPGTEDTLWNLGPNSANPVSTANGYTYEQSWTLTINTNCGQGDTCNDTPQWSITSSNGQLVLSTTSGSSTTIRKGSSMGNCQWDTLVSVNIGGFSSDSTAFIVNSPYQAVRELYFTEATTFGCQDHVTWQISDVCAGGGDRLTYLPLHEEFGQWTVANGTSGWTPPSATTLYFSVDDITFEDNLVADCSNCVPPPIYNNPPQYFAVLMSAPQKYYAGSATLSSGYGTQIYSGTIVYYRDHADTH